MLKPPFKGVYILFTPKVIGSGFKGYNMLISITLGPIVWIGLFHPLGETWNWTRLTRKTIDRDHLEHFNWEP